MIKNFTAETLYSWKRCIPEKEHSEWELVAFNPDDFFGTSLLFRRWDRSAYAIGVVGEASNSDRFFSLPGLFEFFFASRQTEDTWIILAFDGNSEIMFRIQFIPGKMPLVIDMIFLSGEVQRCMINRQGQVLIGYDNSSYFSDMENTELFSPVTDLNTSYAHPGKKGLELPLFEWYSAEGERIHTISDNINTTVTEINIDVEDRALIAVDLTDPIIRLSLDKISCIEKKCFEGTVIEGITEAGDKSGYLISYSKKAVKPSDEKKLSSGFLPFSETFWLDADSEQHYSCRVFSESGDPLPLDSYSCRCNTILIEESGWLYRVTL